MHCGTGLTGLRSVRMFGSALCACGHRPVTMVRVTEREPTVSIERGQIPGQFAVLCVCTGNVFRSRIAEHHVRLGLAERLGDAAQSFAVFSAGTGVVDGRPVHPSEAAALERCGLPPDARPSRLLTSTDVRRADLILCADRTHRSAVLELEPAALRRTFLLRELARLAAPALERAGSVSGVDDDPATRARTVTAVAATYRGHFPAAGDDAIADPWGEPSDVLASAADLVRDAVPVLLDSLVGPVRRHQLSD